MQEAFSFESVSGEPSSGAILVQPLIFFSKVLTCNYCLINDFNLLKSGLRLEAWYDKFIDARVIRSHEKLMNLNSF
jgi:hypothetical protein